MFPFNVARMQGKVFLPAIEEAGRSARPRRPMTLAEKIFARHMINENGEVGVPSVKPGDTGFARADLRFSHEYVTPMAAIFFERYVGKDAKVNDPASILFFRDHLTFLDEVISEEKKSSACSIWRPNSNSSSKILPKSRASSLHGELNDRKGSEGICHSIVPESYALPGQLNIGSDSHTPHVGAIGCVAFGIGTTDVFNSWFTKDVRVKVPESVKIVIRGKKHENVTAKDFILKMLIAGLHSQRQGAGEGDRIFGRGHRSAGRGRARDHDQHGGGDWRIHRHRRSRSEGCRLPGGAPRHGSSNEAQTMIEGLYSDPDAHYAHVIELDAAEIYSHGRDAGRSGQRQICARAEHAGSGRDRLRRYLYCRQE